MQVEVWSDVVCPWCYIGKRRLETALEQFPHRDQVEVVWRSFQLDPSVPEGETHPTLPALAAKYGSSVEAMRANMSRVEELATAEGLDYHLADGVSGNTLLAHELLHLAAEHGLRNELKERLLHAYFESNPPSLPSGRWSPSPSRSGWTRPRSARRWPTGATWPPSARTAPPRRPWARPVCRS